MPRHSVVGMLFLFLVSQEAGSLLFQPTAIPKGCRGDHSQGLGGTGRNMFTNEIPTPVATTKVTCVLDFLVTNIENSKQLEKEPYDSNTINSCVSTLPTHKDKSYLVK